MLTGEVLRTKEFEDTCGIPREVTVLLVACTPDNVAALQQTRNIWEREELAQPASQRERAHLAVDTAWAASYYLCKPWLGPQNDHYIVGAQEPDGTVKGLSIFYYLPESQTWHLALHVRDPHDQGGSQKSCQLRGVGSEMLGADADIMVRRICATVTLEPLDAAAARFWQSRGFRAAGDATCDENAVCKLTCPGLQGLARAYASTPRDDQDMLCDATWGPYNRTQYSLVARWRRDWERGVATR